MLDGLWDKAGPLIVMGIVALVIGTICLIILSRMPKGIGRELFRILSVLLEGHGELFI